MASTDPGPGPQAGDTFVPSTVSGIGTGFPIVRASDILGSLQTVDTIAERDAIDSGYRNEGMRVWVTTTAEEYQLQGGIANTNWVLAAGPTTGNSVVRDYALGVAAGDAVYDDTTTNQVDRADASAAATAKVLGFVSVLDFPTVGQAVVQVVGDLSGIFASLTIGSEYILAAAPGQIVEVSDTGNANYPSYLTPGSGEVLSPVGTAAAADKLAINVGPGIVVVG